MAARRIISVILVCHLTALAVAAIPNPRDLADVAGASESADDAVSARIRPLLDAVVPFLEDLDRRAWQTTAFVRPLVVRYVNPLGLAQGWKMFANPPHGGEYLRFRYYSTDERAAPTAFTASTELVFPIRSATEHQIVRSFLQGHRDKAISNSFGAYFAERIHRSASGERFISPRDPSLDQTLSRGFVPVVRFFSEQYARRLGPRERLLRTEAWYGWAPSRARGELPLAPQTRAAILDRYHRGPVAETVSQPLFQPIDTVEREADILWLLIYVQE